VTEPVPPSCRMWGAAGLLVLAYVGSFVAAIALTGPPTVHDGQGVIEHSWNEGNLLLAMTGGYVLLLGLLCLTAAMVFLARTVGHRTEAGRWAAMTAAAAGVLYVVTIVAGGLAPGAAALWGFEQGLDLQTALAVNNVRNFAYFAVMPVLGAHALALAAAAFIDRMFAWWVGWGGVIVGVALLLAIPAATIGVQYGMPLWLLWWLGIGVSLLRHRAADRRCHRSGHPSALGREDHPRGGGPGLAETLKGTHR
jgi:hypothetical protein